MHKAGEGEASLAAHAVGKRGREGRREGGREGGREERKDVPVCVSKAVEV